MTYSGCQVGALETNERQYMSVSKFGFILKSIFGIQYYVVEKEIESYTQNLYDSHDLM